MRLVLTAGYNQSRYTLALLHTLQAQGHDIVGVCIVKTFQISRIRFYLRQYGFSIARDKFKTLVLGQKTTNLAVETKYIQDYLLDRQIKEEKLTSYCQRKCIPVRMVNSLNNEENLRFTRSCQPDLIVYSGGGILRKKFIDLATEGVLNAHSGRLPFFRGMNVIEWALLYGTAPYTTIHLIDPGIDTGIILYQEPIPSKPYFRLLNYRGYAVVHNVLLINKVLEDFQTYRANARIQETKDGHQFFVMHPSLKKIVDTRLASEWKPVPNKEPNLASASSASING